MTTAFLCTCENGPGEVLGSTLRGGLVAGAAISSAYLLLDQPKRAFAFLLATPITWFLMDQSFGRSVARHKADDKSMKVIGWGLAAAAVCVVTGLVIHKRF